MTGTVFAIHQGGKAKRRGYTGVFAANIDGSIVLATKEKISSEFEDLGDAEWLVTSYVIAMCATQPLVGTDARQTIV